MRADYIQRLEEERHILDSYIENGVIDMERLPCLPANVRITLLKWISRAVTVSDMRAKTEDGRSFRLVVPADGRRFLLRCEDGDLEMPAYRLLFEPGRASA